MTDENQTKDNVWDLFAKNVKPLKKKPGKIIPELPERNSEGNITLQKKLPKVRLQERIWKGETSERWAHQNVQLLTTKEAIYSH